MLVSRKSLEVSSEMASHYEFVRIKVYMFGTEDWMDMWMDGYKGNMGGAIKSNQFNSKD